jgi:3-mercaptopyruvate sulfurtransferase SseA
LNAQTSSSGSDSTSLAAQDPAMQTITSAAPVQTIAAEELKRLLDSKADVAVIDDALVEAFEQAHVPGAINFPWVAEQATHRASPQQTARLLLAVHARRRFY